MFKKYQLIILSVLALISFIGINIAVSLMFASFVIDTTPDDKYSLGEKTKVWLEGNESNIYMRLYTSGNNKEYARDVLRLLEQYRVNSDGRISIKTIDVEPLSAAEAEATKLGVKEVGNKNYIGLVVSDEEGDFASIPYLNPLRKDYLEHDITRLLSRLNNKDKKTIGVLSSEIKLTATESALDYTTDWPFLDILRNDYNISSVKNRVAYIKNDIDLLLVVNPKNLPEDTVYAIDQYLMRGGNVLIFLDPVSEVAIAEKKYGLSATSLERFLAGFGIKYDYTKIAADMKSDRMITKADNTKVSYPFWINVNFGEQSHNLFNALNTVLLNSAGYLKVFPQNGLSTQVLLSTSDKGGTAKTKKVVFGSVNESINNITGMQEKLPLGILVEGKFTSLFTAPLYKNELYLAGEYAYQSIRLSRGKLAVIADSDILNSKLWNANLVSDQNWYDVVPYTNNFDFVEILIDYLSESNLLSVAPKYTFYNSESLDAKFMSLVKEKYAHDETYLEKEISSIEEQQKKLVDQIRRQEIIMSVPVAQNMQNMEKRKIDLNNQKEKIQQKQENLYNTLGAMFIVINLLLPVLFLLVVVFVYKQNSKKIQIKAERIANECK